VCPCPQVRLSSLAENAFNAVERVEEFSHLTPEGHPPPPPPAPGHGGNGNDTDDAAVALLPPAQDDRPRNVGADVPPEREPPERFPCEGKIEFDDVQMRYRPGLPLVLKGLTFTIEAGQKVRRPACMVALVLSCLVFLWLCVRCGDASSP
jgi:ABC-type multidrug transport system fused ATPase/permease subunit